MLIEFKVGSEPIQFYRNWFTGRAELRRAGEVVALDSPLDLSTHFSLALMKVWKYRIGDHEVVIEKVRPVMLAGVRPHAYRVLVGGAVVAQRRGY